MTSLPGLFGTDGIRDVAGEGKLAPDVLLRIGDAIGYILAEEEKKFECIAGCGDEGVSGCVVLARDTRASGAPIGDVLTERLIARGVRVRDAGVVPTPVCAFLTSEYSCNLGIMISASHNPAQYNGIKLFSRGGDKAPEVLERRIEELVHAGVPRPLRMADFSSGAGGLGAGGLGAGRRECGDEMRRRYIDHVVERTKKSGNLKGIKLVLDCANGATANTAPEIFEILQAEVVTIAAEPCEDNINVDCGSLHPETVAAAVKEHGAMLGCAFDGDGDRVIFSDETGTVRNGDVFMAIYGRRLKAADKLPGNVVVATTMSNLGLELSLREAGISLERTDVGDKYVAARMRETGAALGGEQSGHIILVDRVSTGDGIQTAIAMAEVLHGSGKAFSELAGVMTRYPQVLKNVRVREKPEFETLPEVTESVRSVEDALGGEGRVVLRYSGTEPLARIMIEGLDQSVIEKHADAIADAIRNAIAAE
ncbi:MAG: phosphoglucosamine mutase [Planctomycetota bacterium]|nr:MAG: phosphoglucosamine mutase [Planctomycetota bacterium]